MKNTLLITSLVVVSFTLGCNRTENTDSAAKQLADAKVAGREAVQQMRDYSYAQKAEFVALMQTRLSELDAQLDAVGTKIEKSSDAMKADLKPKLEALREQSSALKKQLGAIADATPSTWDTIKADSDKAYTALKDGVTQTRQWISDKIAP